MIKGLFRIVGLDVRLVRNVEAHAHREWEAKWAEQWQFLARHRIGTIIDVGANTGQFAKMIHRVCPQARLYAFEPIADCFEQLQRTLATIPGASAFHMALGDQNGTITINRSEFTPCSSMLPVTDLLTRDYPDAGKVTPQKTDIARLDDVMGDKIEGELLVKIDVQGYEPEVIAGGRETLARASYVAVEVTFQEQYVGQPLFDGVYQLMTREGFIYRGSAGQYESKSEGLFAYADAVFENPRLVNRAANQGTDS